MSPWTQEPWIAKKIKTEVGFCYRVGSYEMVFASHGGICLYDDATSLNPHPEGEQEANSSRIVACINGCAGLNPGAYREVVETLKMLRNDRVPACWCDGLALQGGFQHTKQCEEAQSTLTHAEVSHA